MMDQEPTAYSGQKIVDFFPIIFILSKNTDFCKNKKQIPQNSEISGHMLYDFDLI